MFLIVTRGRIGVKQPRRPLPKQNAFSELAELNIHVLDNMFFLFLLNIFFLFVQNFILTHIVSQNSFCFDVTTLLVKIKFLEYWFLTVIIIIEIFFVSILKAYRYQIKINFFSILSYLLPKYGIIFSLIAHPTHESLLLKTNGYCLLN